MKVLILAGGYGTRISEETDVKPKPMVLIGEKPILWHVMSIYAAQGYKDFVIAGGYKYEAIDEWVQSTDFADWSVTSINTGLDTQTGGRIRQSMEYIGNERFFVTYGDGLGNVPIEKVLNIHVTRGKLATVTAVHPPARFGVIEIEDGLVSHFGEKDHTNVGWINGGFFVLEPEVIKYIHDDSEPFEKYSLPRLVSEGQLGSYEHEGFWQPMDTLRERNLLTGFLEAGKAPWMNF